ncbi:MAG: ribokinase, partial [Candidatus Methylomirabilales bacterium]
MAVVVVGSANLDYTVRVSRLPEPGETVLGGGLLTSHGGKGANQAVAARRAGAAVTFIGKRGADGPGEAIARRLAEEGINTEGLLTDPGAPTGVAFIAVDPAGQNQIVVAPGANAALTVEDLLACRPLLKGGRVLLTQLETPIATVQEALTAGQAFGMATVLNPAPAAPWAPELFRAVDLLVPNEQEAALLADQPVRSVAEAEAAAARLLSFGCKAVLVTLGSQGALLLRPGGARHFPAFPVEAVDATAAGDAFCGALAAALAEGRALEEAVP